MFHLLLFAMQLLQLTAYFEAAAPLHSIQVQACKEIIAKRGCAIMGLWGMLVMMGRPVL